MTFLLLEKIHSLAVNESLSLTSLPKACLGRSVCCLNDIFLFHRLCRKILCASLKHYQPDVEWRGRCCPGYLPLSVQGHCPHPPPCSTASRLTLGDYTYSLSCLLVLSWIWPMGRHLLIGSSLSGYVLPRRLTAPVSWSSPCSSLLVTTASPSLFRHRSGGNWDDEP